MKQQQMFKIRKANAGDIEGITEIYNVAILNSAATLDTRMKSVEDMEVWFRKHGPRFPILVAEYAGQVIGWASLSEWSDRLGYSDTAEISVYVKEGYRGKGIGPRIAKEVLDAGRQAGIHAVIARITETSRNSIVLFENLGFTHVGVMKEVGRKFGRLLDVYVMQKLLLPPRLRDRSLT